MRLKDKKIGILFESDFYEQEIWYYIFRFREEGVKLHILTLLWGQKEQEFHGHEYQINMKCNESFEGMSDEELASYSAIIVPSGMVADRLRYTEDVRKSRRRLSFLLAHLPTSRLSKVSFAMDSGSVHLCRNW